MDILTRISDTLIGGDDENVARLTRQAIDQGIPAKDILDRGLIGGMNTVGERFKVHEIFLPEVLLSARAMHAGLDEIKPLLIRDGVPSRGKVIIGSVQGDLHDIGKNLVGIMLKGAAFEVIDLGNDVAPESFVETATRENAVIIGMSALLTTTMPMMGSVVNLVREQGLGDRLKIIIGGAPVSEEYARQIGADAYGFDAANAVDRVKSLVGVN